jgi:hypothetical protein
VSAPASPQRRERRPDFLARFQSALPLLVVYFALAAVYSWQASRRPVPTIFTDELELTQLARSIAATGHPARLDQPYGLASLVAYLLAPVWWLGSTSSAYAAGKLLLVLTMTSTVFPAYGLARMVAPRWYALAAAGASVALPALTYAPIFVEEPLAYPLATLALWLIARLVARPSWGRFAAAFAASALGVLTRTQLAVLFAVLVLGLLSLAWESVPARRWRSAWTGWDWAGAVTLVVGAVLGFSALMGHLSTSWRNTTFIYKGRIFDHATWALGALAIGMGVLPLVIGVAALARPKDEPRDPDTRAFVVTAVAALGAFVWYAGIKGAYLSTVFATYVYERNLIYLAPILLAATALAFSRGIGRAWAIALAAVVTVYVVNAVPVVLRYPYYEAHGLAILAFANRELAWSEEKIEHALVVVSLVAVAVAVALRFLRRGSPALTALAAVSAVVVVTWSMTTQVYAAEGERTLSRQVESNLPRPFDWVDRATGGKSVVVLGQQISDPTGVWLTEFFNRSIRKIWSLDGTAINVGAPILTPDLNATDGTLTPSPDTQYALGINGVNIRAPVVERRGDAVIYKLDGPIRLKDALIGRESDGWIVGKGGETVATGSYTRYDVSQDGPGFAVVKLSRHNWCPRRGHRQAATATVRIGPVGIGPDKQPAIAHVTDERTVVVKDCFTTDAVLFRPPKEPWRVEVSVSPTFAPRVVDPTKSDNRQLGAVFDAHFQPLFGG